MFSIFKNSDNSFLGIFIWCEKGYPPVNNYYLPQQQVPQQVQVVQRVNHDNYYMPSVPYVPSVPYAPSAPSVPVTVEDDYIFNTSCSNDPIYYNSGVPPTLTLEDLDFLRPFVDAQTAASFGW